MLKFTISILFLVLSFGAIAQQKVVSENKSEDIEPIKKVVGDSLKVKSDFRPSMINIGLDALGLARTFTSSGFRLFEAQGAIDFHRYFFVLDIGHEKNTLINDTFSYSNSGNYFRTGIQINMMPYNSDKSFFFFGFRYARSSFSNQLDYNNDFEKWGNNSLSIKNSSLSARWFEVNMGMKVKIFERVYFGYTLRFKLGKVVSGFDQLIPRNIPGFGRADKGSNAGFNYYILYNIPFRDKPVPPKPKRKSRSTPAQPTQSSSSFQRPF